MSEEEIVRLVADFEAGNPVEEYWAFGWQVWPALRIAMAADLYFAANYPGSTPAGPSVDLAMGAPHRERLDFWLGPLCSFFRWRWEVRSGATLDPGRTSDVVVVGSGHRYQPFGGRPVHYPTGPLVERLEGAGLRCQVWQLGEQAPDDATPAANVVAAIRMAQRLASVRMRLAPPSTPAWFAKVAEFYRRNVGRPLTWERMTQLAGMKECSRVVQRWLRRANPGLVVVDHWYNGPMMAVTLAAKQLGLPVVDLQHGIQEQSHAAYHWWVKSPLGGWPTVPDMFWVWGRRTEALFLRTNRLPMEVLRGGSLWLDLWLSDADPRVEEACKAVRALKAKVGATLLATLPYPADLCLHFLKEAISLSPMDWTWILRLHPRDDTDPAWLQKQVFEFGRCVRTHAAKEWPLYALLREVDLHVGVDSTCPNEALAFGKPTVLISEPGATCFRAYLDAGLMFHASLPETFAAVAQRALAADPELLREAGRLNFTADPRDIGRALERLVEIARRRPKT